MPAGGCVTRWAPGGGTNDARMEAASTAARCRGEPALACDGAEPRVLAGVAGLALAHAGTKAAMQIARTTGAYGTLVELVLPMTIRRYGPPKC